MNQTTFADRIVAQRVKLNLTQRGLARQLGISNSTLSVWEKGGADVSAQSLLELAEFFNVDPVWLYTGEERNTWVTTPRPKQEPPKEMKPKAKRLLVKGSIDLELNWVTPREK